MCPINLRHLKQLSMDAEMWMPWSSFGFQAFVGLLGVAEQLHGRCSRRLDS